MNGTRTMLPANRILVAFGTALLALVFLTLPSIVPARAAVEIQEVTSRSGVTAWLVEEYSVPIIAMRFAFEGGSTQEPDGREGLAGLMTGLFDEGAGDLDSDAFQERMADSGVEIGFNSTRDAIFGSMRALAEDRDEAFALLRLAIQEPRFDEAPVERIRAQLVARIKASARDPGTEGDIAWARAVYGDHPYARRDQGSEESLGAVTVDDLRAFHRRTFARDNLHVGVVGAIDAETLRETLDFLFADLPETADIVPVGRADLRLEQEIRVDHDLPQTSIRIAYPGIQRDSPDFFPAFMMNQILGGGTFSSWLFNEVRERRGLAYGISSALVSRAHASALMIGTSTRADRAEEAIAVIRAEIRRMAEEGPSEEELAAAKRYVIGAYAINNLDSSGAIARTLVQLQLEDLGIDYIERRAEIIEAVTLDEVRAAARKLLVGEPAIMFVGPQPVAEGESVTNGD